MSGETTRRPTIVVAAMASLGAGAIHGGAIGLHAEHPQLARIFVILTLLQIGWALVAFSHDARWVAPLGAAVNGIAVGGWLVTRVAGIGWIDGLEIRENPQVADTACAVLGAIATAAALGIVLLGRSSEPGVESNRLRLPAVGIAAVTALAMWNGAGHVHSHGSDNHAENAAHAHEAGGATDVHSGTTGDTASSADLIHTDGAHAHSAVAGWPRAYDPSLGIDISGVPGVTPEQEARARALIEDSLRELPHWSDVDTAVAEGWFSIGDKSTGFEHYINRSLIEDGKFLDPTAPESLVYRVDGDRRTLVSAMFIAKTGVPIDDPSLVDFAGPLMQWHAHDNLCWGLNQEGRPVILALTNAAGECPSGTTKGGGKNAMVHVWIAPHPCGPFAALEGVGAGRASVSDAERVDMCSHDHASGDASASAGDSLATPSLDSTTPPAQPSTELVAASRDSGAARIDLSGMVGVSPEQEARAEDLVFATRTILPKFSTTAAAEAAGFTTIGDGSTGYEHFINWKYINDEHELNPDFPESLVFQVDPATGTKKLVSAMFMMGDEYTLENVPDVGGPLTQWHIHNNLCFSRDPFEFGSTRVVGVTSPNGTCGFGIRLRENPMIHVWIVPHPCGPFAALEGVGAGQILDGQERLCDHGHAGH